MTNIVISQPMFFPWVGLFEQIRLADLYVHYDDVQLPQGRSFMSRVQIKTATGSQWLTVPVCRGAHLINEALVDETQDWRARHLHTLQHSYARAPFVADMLDLVGAVYAQPTASLAALNQYAIETIAQYFGLRPAFAVSSQYQLTTTSSQHLLDLLLHLGGTVYITGHGARNYLDHRLFEDHGIAVEYMDYQKLPYPQLHGAFTPYVSILDLIANQGPAGREWLVSGTIHWREFIT